MSLSIRKSQVFNDGTVQIEMVPDNKIPYYYRIDGKYADAFISESRTFDKKASQTKVLAILTGIFGGTFGANYFTKKMDNSLFKYLINSACGISAALLMDALSGEYLSTQQKNICNKYGAKTPVK